MNRNSDHTPDEHTFWNDIEKTPEHDPHAMQSGTCRVWGAAVAWRLGIAPLLAFLATLVVHGAVFRGRRGLKEAVHCGMRLFTVNARLYEREKGDTVARQRIEKEWAAPDNKRQAE